MWACLLGSSALPILAKSDGRSACEQMRVSQAAPQRAPPPQQGDPLGHLDTGALGRLLAANQALVQQQVSASCCAGHLVPAWWETLYYKQTLYSDRNERTVSY
jgi:hypothetical protein